MKNIVVIVQIKLDITITCYTQRIPWNKKHSFRKFQKVITEINVCSRGSEEKNEGKTIF